MLIMFIKIIKFNLFKFKYKKIYKLIKLEYINFWIKIVNIE